MDFDITRRQINWLWIIAFLLLCVGGVVYFFSKDIGIVLIWLPALLMIAIVPAEIAYRFPKFMDAVLMSFSALVGGLFIICLLIILKFIVLVNEASKGRRNHIGNLMFYL